jgi:hypothetical protein
MKACLVLPALLAATTAQAKDGFEAVRCGGDVRGALLGRTMSDAPVMEIEKRHADLGLEDLGGDEITDDLNSVSWRICGKEYVVTVSRHGAVRDVLAFPEHSKASPEFGATQCVANGKKVSGDIIGVLDGKTVKAAWTVDEKSGKFAALPSAGLSCSDVGVITADGEK